MKMAPTINSGFGTCVIEATTQVVAPLSWITEGRELQYAATVLAAIHDHNRKTVDGEFIALDFPRAEFRREFAGKPGVSARLIGSRTALVTVLESDRLRQFRRRSIRDANVLISRFEPLDTGYCLVRSRRTEKVQPGAIRRRIARARRQGLPAHHIEQLKKQLLSAESQTAEERRTSCRAPREAAIFLGQKPFFFTRKKVLSSGKSARVSTYGMSSIDAPVIFDRWIADRDAQTPPERTAVDSILANLFVAEKA